MKHHQIGLFAALFFLLLLSSATWAGGGQVLEGWLELRWGDPHPSVEGDHQFHLTLVDQAGVRHALDAGSALATGTDLYALSGHLVAARVSVHNVQDESSQYRVEALAALDERAADTSVQAVTGQQNWILLACRFADVPDMPRSIDWFETTYSNDEGMLGHYWQEVSYGKMNIDGSAALGWYTLPHPRSHYVTGGNLYDADLDALLNDCTAQAIDDVNFGDYIGVELMFNDELDGAAWGGGWCGLLDGISGCWSATWYPPWGYDNLAVRAHEMGHGFGLPHANNSDMDGDPYDNPWDVLSDAWYNATFSAEYGIMPKHISIYSRDRLGWVDESRQLDITGDGSWSTLLRFAGHETDEGIVQVRIFPPDHASNHYYVLEAREQAGVYDGQLGTRRGLEGTSVIIHEVLEGRSEPAWSMDALVPPADRADNRESMFKVGDQFNITPDYELRVTGQTAEGFWINISTGELEEIFEDRFEQR